RGDVELSNIGLDYFKPITNRYNLSVDSGVLSAGGHVEYAPNEKTVAPPPPTIDGIKVDYIHTAPTAVTEKETRANAAETAKQASNAPGLLVRINELRLTTARG